MTNSMFVNEIVVVTVTYGDRAAYIVSLVNRLVELDITKIVIVDNNMNERSKALLSGLISKYSGRVDTVHLSINTGSANAFKVGLETAAKYENYDYILMLDDDNLPDSDLFQVLERDWGILKNSNPDCALSCNRIFLGVNERIVAENEPWILLGRPNSFLGFHIVVWTLGKIKQLLNGNTRNREHSRNTYGKVNFAPYGGLFFRKELLEIIGYPNEQYVVYADDCEYSYRITMKGGAIYALLDAKIHDMDNRPTMHKFGNVYNYYANYYDRIRTYYTLRNTIHFQYNYHCTNKMVFMINLSFYYLICISYVVIGLNLKRIPIFIESFWDGIRGNLGQSKNYRLADLSSAAGSGVDK